MCTLSLLGFPSTNTTPVGRSVDEGDDEGDGKIYAAAALVQLLPDDGCDVDVDVGDDDDDDGDDDDDETASMATTMTTTSTSSVCTLTSDVRVHCRRAVCRLSYVSLSRVPLSLLLSTLVAFVL